MGNKRKHKDSEDKIRKKIRKLEKKLSNKKRFRRLSSSSSDENNEDVTPVSCNQDKLESTIVSATPSNDITECALDYPLLPNVIAAAEAPSVTNLDSDLQTSSEPVTEVDLDKSILNLLGDAPQNNIELGPSVHKDIALRWQEILHKGLKEEIKNKILSDHLRPTNIDKLVPPILNAEVQAALPETLTKRDFSIQQRQKQIAISLSALSKSMTTLLTDKITTVSQPEILKSLSDAGRLLCDTFHNETRIRRMFIINAINIQMKNAIIDTTPDKYLFGENLCEKLKAAQNIKKSSEVLKPIQKFNMYNKNNCVRGGPSSSNFNKNLNQRGPYRRTAARPDMGRPRPPARTAPALTAPLRARRRSSPPPQPPSRPRYHQQNR